MNETNVSDNNRRQYPRNQKGGKDEWRGIIQHQQSINDEIAKTEIGIKALKSNLLMTEIQKQQLEVLQRRQQELEFKKRDTEDVMRKNHQYLEKEQDRQIELRLLDEARRKLEYDDQMRQEKRRKEKEMALAEIQYKESLKRQIKEEESRLRTEVNDQNNKNLVREMMKEANYKNFYMKCSDNQNYLMELHKNAVLSAKQEKDRQIQELINKRVYEENKKIADIEMEKARRKQEEQKFVGQFNKFLISDKEQQKEADRNYKKLLTDQRMNELANYNQYLESKRREKSDVKNEYRSILENQLNQQSDDNLKKNQMTKEEKRFNYYDLQAYKDQHHALYSMIPGWSPQVGIVKPFQKMEPRMDPINIETVSDKGTPGLKKVKDPMLKPAFYPNQAITNLVGMPRTYGISPLSQNPYIQQEIQKNKNIFSQLSKPLQNYLNMQNTTFYPPPSIRLPHFSQEQSFPRYHNYHSLPPPVLTPQPQMIQILPFNHKIQKLVIGKENGRNGIIMKNELLKAVGQCNAADENLRNSRNSNSSLEYSNVLKTSTCLRNENKIVVYDGQMLKPVSLTRNYRLIKHEPENFNDGPILCLKKDEADLMKNSQNLRNLSLEAEDVLHTINLIKNTSYYQRNQERLSNRMKDLSSSSTNKKIQLENNSMTESKKENFDHTKKDHEEKNKALISNNKVENSKKIESIQDNQSTKKKLNNENLKEKENNSLRTKNLEGEKICTILNSINEKKELNININDVPITSNIRSTPKSNRSNEESNIKIEANNKIEKGFERNNLDKKLNYLRNLKNEKSFNADANKSDSNNDIDKKSNIEFPQKVNLNPELNVSMNDKKKNEIHIKNIGSNIESKEIEPIESFKSEIMTKMNEQNSEKIQINDQIKKIYPSESTNNHDLINKMQNNSEGILSSERQNNGENEQSNNNLEKNQIQLKENNFLSDEKFPDNAKNASSKNDKLIKNCEKVQKKENNIIMNSSSNFEKMEILPNTSEVSINLYRNQNSEVNLTSEIKNFPEKNEMKNPLEESKVKLSDLIYSNFNRNHQLNSDDVILLSSKFLSDKSEVENGLKNEKISSIPKAEFRSETDFHVSNHVSGNNSSAKNNVNSLISKINECLNKTSMLIEKNNDTNLLSLKCPETIEIKNGDNVINQLQTYTSNFFVTKETFKDNSKSKDEDSKEGIVNYSSLLANQAFQYNLNEDFLTMSKRSVEDGNNKNIISVYGSNLNKASSPSPQRLSNEYFVSHQNPTQSPLQISYPENSITNDTFTYSRSFPDVSPKQNENLPKIEEKDEGNTVVRDSSSLENFEIHNQFNNLEIKNDRDFNQNYSNPDYNHLFIENIDEKNEILSKRKKSESPNIKKEIDRYNKMQDSDLQVIDKNKIEVHNKRKETDEIYQSHDFDKPKDVSSPDFKKNQTSSPQFKKNDKIYGSSKMKEEFLHNEGNETKNDSENESRFNSYKEVIQKNEMKNEEKKKRKNSKNSNKNQEAPIKFKRENNFTKKNKNLYNDYEKAIENNKENDANEPPLMPRDLKEYNTEKSEKDDRSKSKDSYSNQKRNSHKKSNSNDLKNISDEEERPNSSGRNRENPKKFNKEIINIKKQKVLSQIKSIDQEIQLLELEFQSNLIQSKVTKVYDTYQNYRNKLPSIQENEESKFAQKINNTKIVQDRCLLLYKNGQEIREKQEKFREIVKTDIEKKENVECTFKPKILKNNNREKGVSSPSTKLRLSQISHQSPDNFNVKGDNGSLLNYKSPKTIDKSLTSTKSVNSMRKKQNINTIKSKKFIKKNQNDMKIHSKKEASSISNENENFISERSDAPSYNGKIPTEEAGKLSSEIFDILRIFSGINKVLQNNSNSNKYSDKKIDLNDISPIRPRNYENSQKDYEENSRSRLDAEERIKNFNYEKRYGNVLNKASTLTHQVGHMFREEN